MANPPTLPAPPRALSAILEAASDPEVRIDTLARVVSADPSFASMLLKTANSVRHRGTRPEPITDVKQATVRIGVRALRNYALCHAARSCAAARTVGAFDLQRFWEDSLVRAVAGEMLAEKLGRIDPSLAFTTGLLQEIGVVALAVAQPQQAGEWASLRDLPAATRLAGERRVFGSDHTEAAALLAREWGLPEDLAIPMTLHHHPERAPQPLQLACEVAQAGEALAAVLGGEDARGALDRARLLVAALYPKETVDQLVGQLGERVRVAADALDIAVGPQRTLEQILEAANKSLVDMNLSYEALVEKLERVLAEKNALADELDRRNRELERLSVTDPLTALPNRRELFRRSHDSLSLLARYGGAVAMIVADIDHFKRINDTYGHVYGDEVLRRVSEALAASVREHDLVARTGGEEFAILLPHTDAPGAAIVARRLLGAVAGLPLRSGQVDIRLTISLGIAWMVGPHRGELHVDKLATRLYDAADRALYQSKQAGRNRATQQAEPMPWLERAKAGAA